MKNKQDKLTNPLTQSNVVNNLTSTSTVNPLSAYQGKVLNDKIGYVQRDITFDSYGTVALTEFDYATYKHLTATLCEAVVAFPLTTYRHKDNTFWRIATTRSDAFGKTYKVSIGYIKG